MNKKLTIAAVIAMIAMAPAMATVSETDNKTPTSKGYVDTAIDTRQVKVPATGTNAAANGAGDTVVTYTTTAGTIGERGIYSNTTNYNSSSDGNKLVTAAALNSSVTSLPTMETTKLVCANPDTCDLWTIQDQNVYGRQQQQQQQQQPGE